MLLSLTSAETARLRSLWCVEHDRATVPAGFWRKVRGENRGWWPPPVYAPQAWWDEWLRRRKPAYRWVVRK